jgi:hypothetical protein
MLFVGVFAVSPLAVGLEENICVDITPITTFHDGDASETLAIEGGMYDTSTKILVPMGLDVYAASLDITGHFINNEATMDMIILNDVSASMGDNVEDMKPQTKEMIDFVLLNTYNKVGLVSFRTTVEDVKALTNDKQELFNIVDTYKSRNATCIACAIDEGTKLLEERGTPQRVMLLLTNGEANMCTYGLCLNPKEQAIEYAEHAWLYHGIKIYAVPYSDDSDFVTLQAIVDATEGKLYAVDTPMPDVYSDFENIFTGSPSDVALDLGNDGSNEFFYAGEFLTTENVDFASSLQSLLACECDGCSVDGENCLIDLNVSSATTGVVILNNLMITGCINQTNVTGVCGNEILEEGEECESSDDCLEGEYCSGCVCYSEGPVDNDDDGYTSDVDCNDNDASIHPGAVDTCDGIDNNCDGTDNGCGGGGGGGGGGGSARCGDGILQGWRGEECEGNIYCGVGYVCNMSTCECVSEPVTPACIEDWSCIEWGACSQEGIQTRTCTDANTCGTTSDKPAESQTCTYTGGGASATITQLGEAQCGNGECETGESCDTCPEDCGVCGAGVGAMVGVPSGAGLIGMIMSAPGAAALGLLIIVLLAILVLLATKRRKKK